MCHPTQGVPRRHHPLPHQPSRSVCRNGKPKRQRTLAERKAQAAASASPPAAPATPTLAPRQTMLGLGRGLLSWSQCPVPLTAVVNRERDEHGQTQDWVLVTTAEIGRARGGERVEV